MSERRGSIAFFATFRPPLPLDLYSCPFPPPPPPLLSELHLTDGASYNYNGCAVPAPALKTILASTKLGSLATPAYVDSGRVSALVFVSERTDNLETLHLALLFHRVGGFRPEDVVVVNFGELYGTFMGARMEDSGCFAGDWLVYVSTMQPPAKRRQPWTAVFKTNLKTGETMRITPRGEADLNPAVSPSGKQIAVASFQLSGWNGEIDELKTDIFVQNVEEPFRRRLLIRHGGWPSWATDDILFFHRKVGMTWGVFRADFSNGHADVARVTPAETDAVTPAAIDVNRVAVATIHQKSQFTSERTQAQYRHIEIFHWPGDDSVHITQKIRPMADHFNPFVIVDHYGGTQIGYHRTKKGRLKSEEDVPKESHRLLCPLNDVGLFRVSGVFPSFTLDGTRFAFVDNDFKKVWVVDEDGPRVAFEAEGEDSVFSPVWNQNPEIDMLYVCRGPSFHANEVVDICAIPAAAACQQMEVQLTDGYNNAFPSTNPEGTKLVFRSTRDGGSKNYKNLYIMENASEGDFGEGKITRLTKGNWIDTHCQWSPQGDWIVFSSTRDKPKHAPDLDNGLDPGYFAVFLVKPDDPSVLVRVIGSGSGSEIPGHVNHPFFSPDGESIVFVADLAAVSADPISLPLFLHSVRPYGDIFSVDIDRYDIRKNKDVKEFKRITHSRFENSTGAWTLYSTHDSRAAWNQIMKDEYSTHDCPYLRSGGGQSFDLLRIRIPKRC